ncbi:hypothetical protein DACRYDRAFT_53157 [Dacryopinax primogenitus]|uniref:DUF6534 domain-containing protein n=1 Tax=Dacryopinax primogenitus (strain DJM 731) TaxID=1858805 RepID=M5FV56_DACPD|nr:uncharacterized protein DACRYDRAFT_53157 [Dacryopinax primogenitus]EJU01656.1 hypothetical protein DACRYDRAFT_53157 [Dacryopinax primogenitus]
MAAGPAIDASWGAVLIGVFLAIFLYGLLTLQVYVYHDMFPRDVWWLKLVVASVWILDTLHTVFISHLVYTNLITNFGDYEAIEHNGWSFNINVLITTFVAAISQVFFIHRCWRCTIFNTIASSVILLFACVQFAFGSLCTHLTFILTNYSQFLEYKWAVDTWLGSAAVTDILVSCALVRSLLMKRNEVQRTRNLIEKLIRWTVTTGLITSVWALLDLAVFTGSETTLIHLFFNIMLAKMYANTLLAALNHRTSNKPEDSPILPTSTAGHSISLSRLSRGSRALTLTTTTTMASARRGRTQSVSFALDGCELDQAERGVRVDVETVTASVGSGSVDCYDDVDVDVDGDGDGDGEGDGERDESKVELEIESPSTSLPTLASGKVGEGC